MKVSFPKKYAMHYKGIPAFRPSHKYSYTNTSHMYYFTLLHQPYCMVILHDGGHSMLISQKLNLYTMY